MPGVKCEDATGVRSAVRGVVALTATPSACGHDLSETASRVQHDIHCMAHPSNYVGYEFTSKEYAERTIKHEPVPDRKQIAAIKKATFYEMVLKEHDWWDVANDAPVLPFKRRADGAITVKKADLDDIEEGGDKSSREIAEIVDRTQRESSRRGDKVLESDGVDAANLAVPIGSLQFAIDEAPADFDVLFVNKLEDPRLDRRFPWRSDLVKTATDAEARGDGGPVTIDFFRYRNPFAAGISGYVVSDRFLEKIAARIAERGADMVDAWMYKLCGDALEYGSDGKPLDPDATALRCYSATERSIVERYAREHPEGP